MPSLDPERNARQSWSQADLAQLRELLAARVPVREIADRMGRSEYAVRSKASQAGISLKPPAADDPPRRPR
ncbi:MAG TPA: hypothetical protein PKC18_17105 [Lacipirellulaceae bacterium]|nr:hypothetical protein [Lacipirellulaceae bacterium]HMP06714.1 hypothetical protein [Lacipirellulaceae bacterium]